MVPVDTRSSLQGSNECTKAAAVPLLVRCVQHQQTPTQQLPQSSTTYLLYVVLLLLLLHLLAAAAPACCSYLGKPVHSQVCITFVVLLLPQFWEA